MPTPPLSDDLAREAVEAWQRHYRSHQAAADDLGVPKKTFQHRLTVGKMRGFDIDPAIRDGMAAVGTGLVPSLVWAKTDKKDGISYSAMLRPAKEPPEAVAERMLAVLADVPPAPRIAAPAHTKKGYLGLHVVSDLHYGATISQDEAGIEYNREIAQDRARTGFAECNAAMPPCEVAVVLYNGDTTHANDDKHRTPKSGHPLRVEGSHQSNLFAVEHVIAWQTDEALAKHDRVYLVIKPGNHDPNTPAPLIMAMRARYRDNPRVTVVDDENPYFVFQMGRLFVCAHHGDGASPMKRALSIPHKFRREWGVSDFHWFFTGDKHHAKADTFGGLHWRQVPSIISLEQHSHAEGYSDTSGMYAAWFDTETGRVSQTEIRF